MREFVRIAGEWFEVVGKGLDYVWIMLGSRSWMVDKLQVDGWKIS